MRYVIDLAVLGVVFLIFMLLFKNASAAIMAALILAGAADALIWDLKKR